MNQKGIRFFGFMFCICMLLLTEDTGGERRRNKGRKTNPNGQFRPL